MLPTSRPCQHDSPPKVLETRKRANGSRRRAMRCDDCGLRWSMTDEAGVLPPRNGAQPTISRAVARELLRLPGCWPADIGAVLHKPRTQIRRSLVYLIEHGQAIKAGLRYWHADHAEAAKRASAPPPPPAPPAPAARYVGPIVPCRQTPRRTPERVEWRQIAGQLVRVTIGPSVIEPAAPLLPSVPWVRVVSSQWGRL